jgi:hypothetical protein
MTGHVSQSWHPFTQQESSKSVSYNPAALAQGNSMSFKRRLVKWLGLLSALSLGAAAFAPDFFRILPAWRPWVFVISIAWFFAFCAGMFDPWK